MINTLLLGAAIGWRAYVSWHRRRQARQRKLDLPMYTQRTALYRWFDKDGNLLYVGITNNPARRVQEHGQRRPDWWSLAVGMTIAWYPNRLDAALAETNAIRSERPIYNQVGAVK